MKTTLNLDDDLLQSAKRRAADRGTTLTKLVEQALAAELARPTSPKPYTCHWTTRQGRLVHGVDLSDRNALYDQMEGRR